MKLGEIASTARVLFLSAPRAVALAVVVLVASAQLVLGQVDVPVHEPAGAVVQAPERGPSPCIDCSRPGLIDPPKYDWPWPELGIPPFDFDQPVYTFFVDPGKWLDAHPEIRDALIFEGVAYPHWPEADRRLFADIYNRIYWHKETGLEDPPDNQATPDDDKSATTHLLRDAAFQLFSTYAAQLIALEAQDALPWSVYDLTPKERGRLFHSRTLFKALDSFSPAHYWITSYSTWAPADAAYAFLKDNGLLGTTRQDTIGRLIGWSRNHLKHFAGHHLAGNCEDYWGYRGAAPASRVISGTVHASSGSFGHYIAGCYGVTAFYQGVLHSVGIPVHRVTVGDGHTAPYFPSEKKYLSHGDDVHSQATKTYFCYDGEELLTDEETFNRWFLEAEDSQANVGRQACVISHRYISHALLRHYCLSNGSWRERMLAIYHSKPAHSGLEQCLDEAYLTDFEAQEALHEKIEQAIEAQPEGCETITWDFQNDWANLVLCREIR